MKVIQFIVLCGIFVCASGFASNIPRDLERAYSYDKSISLVEHKLIRTKTNFFHYRGKLQASDRQHRGGYQIKYELYKNRKTSIAPLVVFMPPLAMPKEDGMIKDFIPNFFASKGFHTLLIMPDEDFFNENSDVTTIDNFLVRNTVAIRQALDHFIPLMVRNDDVFAFALSMGAIRLPYLMAVESRIKHGVFIIGGADIPHILSVTKETKVTRLRNRIMRERGFSNAEEVENYLRHLLTFDNSEVATYVQKDRASVVIALYDTIVPTKNQRLLWRLLGEPKSLKVPTGHQSIAIFAKQILKFAHVNFKRMMDK